MSHEAFQQAICQEPDDDALRLIYADWLDENGDSLWAEFIRIQCELFSLSPASERYFDLSLRDSELRHLMTDHEQMDRSLIRVEELPTITISWGPPQRGFPYSIYVEQLERDGDPQSQAHQLCDLIESTIKNSPIQSLCLDGFLADELEIILDRGILHSMRELIVYLPEWLKSDEEDMSDDLAYVLAQSEQLQALTSLRLYLWLTDEGLTSLARSSNLTNLTNLVLDLNVVTSSALEVLAQSAFSQQLGSLGLRNMTLDLSHIRALTGVTWPHLHTLDFWGTSFSTSAIQTLAKSHSFPNLASLNPGVSYLGPEGIEALSRNSSWNLRVLNLQACNLGTQGAKILAKSSILETVNDLTLANNRIGKMGARALAKSPHLSQLRRLDFSYNTSDASAVQVLTEGNLVSHLNYLDLSCLGKASSSVREGAELIQALDLPSIRHLKMRGIPIGARGTKALAKKEWIRSLRVLDLSDGRIGETGAQALLDSLDLDQMVLLTLFESGLSSEMKDQLRQRLGISRLFLT